LFETAPTVNVLFQGSSQTKSHQQETSIYSDGISKHVSPSKSLFHIVLLRAIGNSFDDTSHHHAVTCLNFTLHNEPRYRSVYKHWVLNRIADPLVESQLKSLLEEFKASYSIIPFDLQVYDSIGYNFGRYQPLKDPIHNKQVAGNKSVEKEVEQAYLFDKFIYVSNQNGARNYMLEIGRQYYPDSEWILPWDGDTFLYPQAMSEILEQLGKASKSVTRQLYFITPERDSVNTTTNKTNTLFNSAQRQVAWQIIFHRNATGRFHPYLHDEQNNKAELLRRLKVPQIPRLVYMTWEHRHPVPLEVPLADLYNPAESIGWVSRIAANKPEHKRKHHGRESLRILDVRAAQELYLYDPNRLVFYDEAVFAHEKAMYDAGQLSLTSIVEKIILLAKQALHVGPWSVVDKPLTSIAPSNDPHDYFTPSPYYWPVLTANGTIDTSKKYISRDGERVPGTKLYDRESFKFDRSRIISMKQNTTILALAYYFTGETEYAAKAARNIRHWFLNPDTRMNPNLAFAQVRRGHNRNQGSPSGIVEMKDFFFFLDAIRLVERSGLLSSEEQNDLREWFRQYKHWLESSTQGTWQKMSGNNHGVFYDMQLVAISAFIGETERMLWYLDQSASRLWAHIEINGSMPNELRRPTCEHYQLFNLQGWSILGRLGHSVGRNLWHIHMMKNESALCRAARYAVPSYRNRTICNVNSPVENVERWWPLLVDARNYCPSLQGNESHWPASWFLLPVSQPPIDPYEMPSMYWPHDAIAPFWNLGLPTKLAMKL
jgi:hypothetical protein